MFRWDNYDKKIDDEWHVLMSIVLVSIPVLIGLVLLFYRCLEIHFKIHMRIHEYAWVMFSTYLFMALMDRWVWCYQPESGKMNDWAIREVSWILYKFVKFNLRICQIQSGNLSNSI